jgi:hypothetical protein
MKNLPIILLVICGMAAGLFFGDYARIRMYGRKAASNSNPILAAPRKGYDLDSLLEWKSLDPAGGSEIVDEIKRLDSNALQNLLAGPNEELKLRSDFPLFTREVAAELYRREGEGCLQWAAMRNYEPSRLLLLAAVKESPEIAKPWIERYQKAVGREWEKGAFYRAAIDGASNRGAKDLVKLKDVFGEEMWNGVAPIVRVREDFDFALFYSQFFTLNVRSQLIMSRWARSDPEAAWQMVGKLAAITGNARTSGLLSFLEGMALGGNEKAAACWFSERAHELPIPNPGRDLGELLRCSRGMTLSATRWMEGLKDPKDRLNLMEGVINPVENPLIAVEGLRALDSDKDRVWIVGYNFARMSRGFVSPDHSANLSRYFLRLLEMLDVSAEGADRLKDYIRENAGER